jgi:tRNA(adenine34) deaminase
MKEALKEAEIALKEGNWPIGCVIVMDNEILSRGRSRGITEENIFGHAEIEALQKVERELSLNPKKATLYTTFEPCPMCFGAILMSKIKRVVSGTNLDGSGSMYLQSYLPRIFRSEKYLIEHETGVLAEECSSLFMKSQHAQELVKEGYINCSISPTT